MKIKAGDVVEIRGLPAGAPTLPDAQRRVYEACIGLRLSVSAVDDDGYVLCKLGQEWDHFPGVTPFDLRFEPACLRSVRPYTDDEWSLLSDWMQRDAIITGTVAVVDGHPVVLLEGGLAGDLVWSDPSSAADVASLIGTTLGVRIIMLNRKRRELIVTVAT